MHRLDGKADSAQVRQQLDRIVRSGVFSGATRLQELLVYAVGEVLAGRGAELKETVIGAEFFARAGYDPRMDSIVRVTVSKLRMKLREYYLTEGVSDPVEIEIPKGGYAPELRWRGSGLAECKVEPAAAPRRVSRQVWGVLAALLVVVALGGVAWPRRGGRRLEAIRFQVAPPDGVTFRPFPSNGRALVSPDGRKVAAVAGDGRSGGILIRPLESLSGWLIPVPGPLVLLTWSPDSRSLAFYREGRLWRLDTAGGSPLEIAVAAGVRSAAWGTDGQIVFASGGAGGLFRIPLKDGKAVRVTEPEPKAGEVQHSHPQFLPGGEELVYTAINADESESTIYRISMRNPAARVALAKAHSNAGFLALPDGRAYLLYVKGGALIAQPFDLRRKSTAGEPFVLEQKVSYYPFHSLADFSASNEVVVSRTAEATQSRKLMVVDRGGRALGESEAAGVMRFPRISPDGGRVAVERLGLNSSAGNLWVAPLERLLSADRLTLDSSGSYGPVWSPDGESIFYGTHRMRGPGIFRKSLRSGAEQLVTERQGTPTSCSPDGAWVLFHQDDPRTSYDLWLAPVDGGSSPVEFRRTRHVERDAHFSSDGKWVIYETNESGSWEIYVEQFLPKSAERPRARVARGNSALWAKGGREIVFQQNGALQAVERLPGAGLKFSEPRRLFPTSGYFHRGFGYDVSADGEKFVFSVPSGQRPASGNEIGVLLWK